MNHIKKHFSELNSKRNQLPKSELIIIFVICLLSSTILFTFYNLENISKSESNQLDTLTTCLNLVVDSADELFEAGIGLPLDNSSGNYSLLALSLTSSSYNIAGGALVRGKSDLNAMVSNSPLISNAFLYIPNADLVVSSSYTSSKLDESVYKNIILTYENQLTDVSPIFLSDSENEISMFRMSDSYIIAKDYLKVGANKQSTIFLVLDTVTFINSISSEIDETQSIQMFLYDPFGYELLSVKDAVNSIFKPEDLVFDSQGVSKSHNYYIMKKQSEKTFFTYYEAVDRSYVRPSFLTLLPKTIPYMLLLIALIFIITMITFYIMYKPIKKISSILGASGLGSDDNHVQAKEFHRLDDRISSLVEQQDQLKNMLHNVSDDVEKRLFWNLINGESVSYDRIVTMLNSINSKFRLNSLYVAIVLNYRGSDLEKASMYFKNANNLVRQFSEKNDLSYQFIHVDENEYALILQFDTKDLSIVSGKRIVVNLINSLKELSKDDNSAVLIDSGHIYHSLLDVGFSFKEASDNMHLQLDKIDSERDYSVEANNSLKELITHRSGQLINSCQKDDDLESIEKLADHVINEIRNECEKVSDFSSAMKDLLNNCYNQIVVGEYIIISDISDVYTDFSDYSENCESIQMMADFGRVKLLELLAEYCRQLKNQQNPYIIASRQYIKEHYSDPQLTLEDVAENVRLSSTYLSKLFKKCLGIKLFQYLTNYRVEMSLKYIHDSDKTIAEISELTGFSSPRNYIRAFKLKYEITPGDYRKNLTR